MTICNVKGVDFAALWSILASFSLLFWFSSPKFSHKRVRCFPQELVETKGRAKRRVNIICTHIHQVTRNTTPNNY